MWQKAHMNFVFNCHVIGWSYLQNGLEVNFILMGDERILGLLVK